MILVVDLTDPRVPVLTSEFVSPVLAQVQKTGIRVSVIRIEDISGISNDVAMIIICGTALADTWYTHGSLPPFLDTWTRPVLGICAGMQMLLLRDGGGIIPSLEIGMTEIRSTVRGMTDPLTSGKEVFSGYTLHQMTSSVPESWIILAESVSGPQIVRSLRLPRYGILFHPEVRNEWLFERFFRLIYETS